ncbi:MAG: threonine aldolase family protein [Planctomycetota bacterium]
MKITLTSSPMRVNLYSDTQTLPTDAMRQAMARAEVGDEQRRQDSTVERLCDRVADLLGKEAAVFLPSGAMCNVIALKTHTQPGDAVICQRECHIVRAECGGAGLVSGVVIDPIDSTDGFFTAPQVAERVKHLSLGHYSPPPRLVCVEQTHNFAGGTVWPIDQLRGVTDVAREHGLATHMDGARLLNAAVATGTPAADFAATCDTVWIDFSKGLGAPVGAALAGSAEFIDHARRYKQMFGGAMRQAGIIAAGALHALDHHIDRLAEDHRLATKLGQAIADIDGLALAGGMPQTNIVFFDVTRDDLSAADLAAKLNGAGVEMSVLHGRLRAVTHRDVDEAGIEYAIHTLHATMS